MVHIKNEIFYEYCIECGSMATKYILIHDGLKIYLCDSCLLDLHCEIDNLLSNFRIQRMIIYMKCAFDLNY